MNILKIFLIIIVLSIISYGLYQYFFTTAIILGGAFFLQSGNLIMPQTIVVDLLNMISVINDSYIKFDNQIQEFTYITMSESIKQLGIKIISEIILKKYPAITLILCTKNKIYKDLSIDQALIKERQYLNKYLYLSRDLPPNVYIAVACSEISDDTKHYNESKDDVKHYLKGRDDMLALLLRGKTGGYLLSNDKFSDINQFRLIPSFRYYMINNGSYSNKFKFTSSTDPYETITSSLLPTSIKLLTLQNSSIDKSQSLYGLYKDHKNELCFFVKTFKQHETEHLVSTL